MKIEVTEKELAIIIRGLGWYLSETSTDKTDDRDKEIEEQRDVYRTILGKDEYSDEFD